MNFAETIGLKWNKKTSIALRLPSLKPSTERNDGNEEFWQSLYLTRQVGHCMKHAWAEKDSTMQKHICDCSGVQHMFDLALIHCLYQNFPLITTTNLT